MSSNVATWPHFKCSKATAGWLESSWCRTFPPWQKGLWLPGAQVTLWGGHSLCPVGTEWSLAPPTRGWKHVGGTTQKYPQTWTNTGAQSKIPPVGPLIQILLLTPGENFPERQQEPHPLVCSPWRRSGTPPRTHGFPPGMVGREEEMDDPRKCG